MLRCLLVLCTNTWCADRHLTGGLVYAGFHEVVISSATMKAIARSRAETPDRPLIRISSTFFYHLSANEEIEPLTELEERRRIVLEQEKNNLKKAEYPKMFVGELVQRCVLKERLYQFWKDTDA